MKIGALPGLLVRLILALVVAFAPQGLAYAQSLSSPSSVPVLAAPKSSAKLLLDFTRNQATYLGARTVPASVPGWTFSRPGYNAITNGNAIGASGNTLPTGWNVDQGWGGNLNPSSWTVTTLSGTVGATFRINGTAAAGNRLLLTPTFVRLPVTAGATYTFSYSVALVAGTYPYTITPQFVFYDSGGTLLTAPAGTTSTPTSTLGRFTSTVTAPANAATVNARLDFTGFSTAGATIDFTMFIGGVQLEPGSVAGGYQPTTGTAVTSGVNTTYAETVNGTLTAFGPNQPRITDRGLLVEESRTNKTTINNANPVSVSGSIVFTNAPNGLATFTVVSDLAAVSAAGLSGAATSGNVYKLDNTLGNGSAKVELPGATGNTNAHTSSAWWRGSGTGGIGVANNIVALVSVPSTYTRYSTTLTPTGSSVQQAVQAQAGSVVYFVLNQFEEGSFPTSPIVTTTASATRAADNASVGGLAAMLGRFRTNKVAVYNANPVDTTGWSKTGDAASTLTVVDDAAALSAAGLSGLASSGKVLKLDNSAGTGVAYALANGATGNTNTHSVAVWVRGGTGAVGLNGGGVTSAFTSAGAYTRRTAQRTPANSSVVLGIGADAGQVVYFILPLLEESATAGADIVTLGAPASAGNPVTLVAWVDFPAAGTTDQSFASISDGGFANQWGIRRNNGGTVGANSRINNSYNPDPPGIAGKTGARVIKAASRIRSASLQNAADGQIVAAGAIVAPPGANALSLGQAAPIGSIAPLNGYIQRVGVYGDMPDSQLGYSTIGPISWANFADRPANDNTPILWGLAA